MWHSELALLRKLLQDGDATLDPLQQLLLHLAGAHLCEALQLLADVIAGLILPLADEAVLLFGAARTVSHRAERRTAKLGDIGLHVLLITELVAHRLVGLLRVGLAVVTRFLVEVPDGGPAAGTRLEVAAVRSGPDLALRKKDVSEGNGGVAGVLFADCIPRRGLLDSSASSFGSDPTDEGRTASVDLALDPIIEIVRGQCFCMGGAHIHSANSGQQTRCQDDAGDHRTLGVVEAPPHDR